MELISDGLLFLAAITASLYCLVLSRRLRRLSEMEGGLGDVISQLSAQVDDMQSALATTKQTTEASASTLVEQTREAGKVTRDLRSLLNKSAELVSAAEGQRRLLTAVIAASEEAAVKENTENFIGPVAPPDFLRNAKPKRHPAPRTEPVDLLSNKSDLESKPRAGVQRPKPAQASEASPDRVGPLTLKPDQGLLQESEISDAVGMVLAAGRTEDDEAFARRLIDALAASEKPFDEAST